MDQYLNNRQNEILWKLLANPADNGYLYSNDLKQLATDFPQSGLLHALYARSNREGMSHAAASFNPKTLYVLLNAYENLAEVPEGQIIQELSGSVYGATADVQREPAPTEDFYRDEIKDVLEAEPQSEETQTEVQVVVGDDEQEEVKTVSDQFENEVAVAEIQNTAAEELIHQPVAEVPEEDTRAETAADAFEEEIIEFHEPQSEELIEPIDEIIEPVIEIPEDDHRANTPLPVFEEEIVQQETPEEPIGRVEETTEIEPIQEIDEEVTEEQPIIEQEIIAQSHPSEDIEDDVYDEIVGIESISFTRSTPKAVEEVVQPEPIAAANELHGTVEEPVLEGETGVKHAEQEPEIEELIPESLAGSDYFVFERSEQITQQPEIAEEIVEEEVVSEMPVNRFKSPDTEAKHVSKYHDEKMPYTFMWWLDKTRKEHAGIYQPFKLDTTQAIKHTGDETLQQQYYENIFHVSTVEELDQSAAGLAVEFDPQRKEDRIIKKFIAEAPHISTPTGDKLDNENKAKRSAEDQDELVTETLARIYTDQMLYHKAINTYKKLILKFPEKSRYFADQIQLLERKIN